MPNSSPVVVLCAVLTCGAVAAPSPAASQTLSTDKPASLVPVQSEWRETPSFRGLFGQTADDFRRLVSRDSVVVAAIGGVAAAVGHAGDQRFSSTMSGSSGLRGAFGPGQLIGSAGMQAAGALATYTMGRMTSNSTVTQIGADLIRAQIVTQTLTLAVKTAVGRTRPDGTQYSFPSGHAAVSFASATVLQRHLGWKAGVPAYAVASYVAASRIQAKRHYLSDVTFGAAVGILGGRSVTIGRGNHRFALAPSAVAGGGGVSLTWVGRN